MNQKKFYFVKPLDSTPPKLPEDLIYKIDVNDIDKLALFASTLKPLPAELESFGCANALFNYFLENSSDELAKTYSQLNSNSRGNLMLCLSIDLFLFEKRNREEGITEKTMESYNKVAAEYRKCLEFNKMEFSNEYNSEKSI